MSAPDSITASAPMLALASMRAAGSTTALA
jgi:hypothetical protein